MTSLRGIAEGKRDIFTIDPRKLHIEPGFNVRDFSLPENLEHVAWLKASIKEVGLKEPLIVRMRDDDVSIVGGECRYRAIMELIEEGEAIDAIVCMPEPKHVSAEERIAELHVRNSGKRFSPVEQAALAKRLLGYGWTEAKIAEKWNMSTSNVSHLLAIETLPEQAKQEVKAGNISPSLAVQTVREHGETGGAAIIKESVSVAKASGKSKATGRTVRAVASNHGGKNIGGKKLGAVLTERVFKFLSGLSAYQEDFKTDAAWSAFHEDYDKLYLDVLKDLQ